MCIRDSLVGGEGFASYQPEIPNASALGEFDPLPILELIQREPFYSLPKRQVFAKTDDVEGDRLGKRKHQFGRGNIIVGSPVGIPLAVQKVSRGELFRAAADVAGGQARPFGQVLRERGIEEATELSRCV